MIIYAFPYAGGSSLMYLRMKEMLVNKVTLVPIEYPGHGFRSDEKCLTSINELVNDAYEQIKKSDNGDEFMILGYSLGSYVAYEVYRKIKGTELAKRLKHIFFCAASHPKVNNKKYDFSNMSDESAQEYFISLGGTQISNTLEMECYKYFIPIIKQDLIICQKYIDNFKENMDYIIDKPISILYSEDESNINEYDKYCIAGCTYKKYDDGHFFINYHLEDVVQNILDYTKFIN